MSYAERTSSSSVSAEGLPQLVAERMVVAAALECYRKAFHSSEVQRAAPAMTANLSADTIRTTSYFKKVYHIPSPGETLAEV